ncbi:hypothetical protein EMIT0P2_30430 [Pseudomonas sp. IT-P2]
MHDLRQAFQPLPGVRSVVGKRRTEYRLRQGTCPVRPATAATALERSRLSPGLSTLSAKRYDANAEIISANVPLPLARQKPPLYCKHSPALMTQ